MTAPLRISAAAIHQHGLTFSLAPPARHHHIIHAMAEMGLKTPITGEQGFLLSDGRFAARIPARAIAYAAGQIINKTAPSHLLFSEDLW